MGVGVVAPAEDAGVWDVVRQELAEPVDTIARGPGLVAVAVEAMDGDDAARGKQLAGDSRNTGHLRTRRVVAARGSWRG